jgi:hypothetical protein
MNRGEPSRQQPVAVAVKANGDDEEEKRYDQHRSQRLCAHVGRAYA